MSVCDVESGLIDAYINALYSFTHSGFEAEELPPTAIKLTIILEVLDFFEIFELITLLKELFLGIH